jgi:hypothetical protein
VDDLLNLPEISIRLRAKRLNENIQVLKSREKEISKKEEELSALEVKIKEKEDLFLKEESELKK